MCDCFYLQQSLTYSKFPAIMALAEDFDTSGPVVWHQLHLYLHVAVIKKAGQCKSTLGCYNELVVAYFRTRSGVKWQKRSKIYTC